MQDLLEGDLTEKMLVKQLSSPETSLISNSVDEFAKPEPISCKLPICELTDKWYRQLRKSTWILCGLGINIIDECLSKISVSTNKRSREMYLDTVENYGEGNWCFEFTHKGSELQQIAHQKVSENQFDEAIRYMRQAGICYSIASYPHLYGDKKAAQTQLLSTKLYREYLSLCKVGFKELEVPIKDEGMHCTVHANLIHPKSDQPVPLIIFAGSLENLCTDYDMFYQLLVHECGCAVLCMDYPRTGQNASIPLTLDSSILHRTVLDYVVENEPIVDSSKIGAVGIRFGGNIVTRMSFMRSNLLKFSVVIGPAINKIFSDKAVLNHLSQMQRAMLCNKIDKNAADWEDCLPLLSQFSLKKQGLLGTSTKTPIMVIVDETDYICDIDDAKFLLRSSSSGSLIKLGKKNSLSQKVQTIVVEIRDCIKHYFN